MANENRNSSHWFKTLLLGGVIVASTGAVILVNQPRLATASTSDEICEVEASSDKKDSAYTRAGFATTYGAGREDGLFWNSLTKTWLSAEQMGLLLAAYDIGYADGGHKHAELLQAVMLQETIAGQLGRIGHMTAPVGKRSYGIMQVKVTAARDVLRLNKELGSFRSDEELIAELLTNDEFNIRIASKFLAQLSENTKSVEKSLVAYNIGLRASRKIKLPHNFKYVVRTNRNLTEVIRPFNQRFAKSDNAVQQVALR